jgi:hypothetical protein
MVISLNNFNEQRRSILNRPGEYLQQVAIVVVVDKDIVFLKL